MHFFCFLAVSLDLDSVQRVNMSDLTIASLEAKIEIVEKDILKVQGEGTSLRKVEALTEYKKYLEDELESLKNDIRS